MERVSKEGRKGFVGPTTGGGAGDAQRMREYLAAGSFLGANSPEA